jgi:hypothetical protein
MSRIVIEISKMSSLMRGNGENLLNSDTIKKSRIWMVYSTQRYWVSGLCLYLCSVYSPYVKRVSEMFRHIGNWYNIRTIFRTKHILRGSLKRNRAERGPQQMAKCVYSIPSECGRSYTGETGRPLAVRLHQHRHNFKEYSRKIKISPTCLRWGS